MLGLELNVRPSLERIDTVEVPRYVTKVYMVEVLREHWRNKNGEVRVQPWRGGDACLFFR